MINFENQSIRGDLSPTFQPPATDYTGRMPLTKSAEVGEYDINPFELRTLDIPSEVQEVLDNKGIWNKPYSVKYLSSNDRREKLYPADIPLQPETLTLVIKAAIRRDDGSYVIPEIRTWISLNEDVLVNNTNTVFMYLKNGKTYVQRKAILSDNIPIQQGGSG